MDNSARRWNTIRRIRLLAGIGIGIYAVWSNDYIFILPAALFAAQALFNLPCCAAGECASGPNDTKQPYRNEIKKYKP